MIEQLKLEVAELSSLHEAYLAPLLKWRILDVEGLRFEIDFDMNYSAFCRSLRLLETKGVIESYRRPNSGKKFVFLTERGEKLLKHGQNPTAISRETLIHDLKVSEWVRAFLKRGWIQNGTLEHELHNKRQFGSALRVIPDALLESIKNKKNCKIALELELNLKSRPRIIEKVRQYLADDSIDGVLYLFSKQGHFESYRELIVDEEGEGALKKIALFAIKQENEPENASGIYRGKPSPLREVFC